MLNFRADNDSPHIEKMKEKVSPECSDLAIKLYSITTQTRVICQGNLKPQIPHCSHQLLITISLSGPNILLRTYFYDI